MPQMTDDGRLRVSVVSPFYNEEAIIADSVRRMTANLMRQFGRDWELILVNDGSRDNSMGRLREALAALPEAPIRVISYADNQGRGRALKIGIDHARGDIIVTTEADCSWGDDIVARLVAELDAHPSAHIVVASPHRAGGGLVNVPSSRVFFTKFGNLLIRLFFESHVTMNTGMTRAYRSKVIQPLVVHENGKEFHLEVLLKLLTLGFRVREIPATITWSEQREGGRAKRKSATRTGHTINSHLRFIAIAQPVRYFAWLAAITLVVGLGFVGAAFWALITGKVPAAFMAIVGLNMLLFSLLFTAFSVLFFQIRESMRESWMRSYEGPLPPSTERGAIVYPPDAAGR